MKTTLEIKPAQDQPYELVYTDATGRTVGVPSYLEASFEEEAREELKEEHGYTLEQIEQLFNAESI